MQNLNLIYKPSVVILLLLMVNLSAVALESDRQQKISLEGAGCVSKIKLGQTECPNGMVIKQGSLLIEADYGLITHKNNQIDTVLMKGQPVHMQQTMEDQTVMHIRANEINYLYSAEIAILTGDVVIENNMGVSSGDAMEFNLKTQELKAVGENKQPFRLEIDPSND